MGESCCSHGKTMVVIPNKDRNKFQKKKFLIPTDKFTFSGELVPFDCTAKNVEVFEHSYTGEGSVKGSVSVSDLLIKVKSLEADELAKVINNLGEPEKNQINNKKTHDEKLSYLRDLDTKTLEEVKGKLLTLNPGIASKILLPFRLNQGYKIKNNPNCTFTPIKLNFNKTKAKPKKSFLASNFSFLILLLATSSAVYAYFSGADVITIFSAVLMCICPCIFLLTDTSLKQVGLLMLKRQGIVCNSEDRFWEIMKMVPNSDLVADKHGTLTQVAPNETKLEEGYRDGVTETPDCITVNEKEVTVITGGTATNNEQKYSNKADFTSENNFIYLCNGPNDIPVIQKKNCISIAVKNSPATIKNTTDFASLDEKKELSFFSHGLHKISKQLLISRYFMYFLGLGYALTIVPLTIVGEISEMWACLSMCIACLTIVGISTIVSLFSNNFKKNHPKVDKSSALNALAKMGWIDEKGNFFSNVYSESVIIAQANYAGIKNNKLSLKWCLGIFFLSVLLIASYLNNDLLDLILGYSNVPIIAVIVFLLLPKVYDIKMLMFVVGCSTALSVQYIINQYMLSEKLNIISLSILGFMLLALFKFPLDMLQVQFSVILILGSLSLFDIISIHSDHLIIMAIALLLTDFLRSKVNNVGMRSPLITDNIPNFASVKNYARPCNGCCSNL